MIAFGLFNYWVVVALVMLGLYVVMANQNLVKKILGLNIFQAAVFIMYISIGKLEGGTAPILAAGFDRYDNPLPHVLILTAIVVGVATTAVGLALYGHRNRGEPSRFEVKDPTFLRRFQGRVARWFGDLF